MLEIATSWEGDLLSVVYVERCASTRELGIPWDVPVVPGTMHAGPLVVHARVVERAPPLPKSRARTDLPMAFAFAVGAHATLFAFALWSHRLAPPIDDVETMRSSMSSDRSVATAKPEDDPEVVDVERAAPEIVTDLPAVSDSPTIRYSVPAKSNDPVDALREAAAFGMIGLLSAEVGPAAADWAPAAIGDGIFKDDPGDGFMAAPTLGLGVGEGGGGVGETISLGTITGFGGARWHGAPIPHVRPHAGQVKTLPPIVRVTCGSQKYADTIPRIVQANITHFLRCARAPSLSGTVRVKFVIERTGEVSTAIDEGSTLPDESVRQCVVGVFKKLSFPEHHGIGYVTYPIRFDP